MGGSEPRERGGTVHSGLPDAVAGFAQGDAELDLHVVREYGVRLLPALYEVYNPMPYDAARDMEVELGIALREAGYGVWQA